MNYACAAQKAGKIGHFPYHIVFCRLARHVEQIGYTSAPAQKKSHRLLNRALFSVLYLESVHFQNNSLSSHP